MVAFVEVGDANAVDGVIELVERVRVVAVIGVRNAVDGNDVAVLLEVFLFEDFALFVVDSHAVVLFLGEVVDDFAEFEVGDESLGYWVDLNAIIFVMDFRFFITFHQGEEFFRSFRLFFAVRFTPFKHTFHPLNEGGFRVESRFVFAEGFRSDDSGFAIILNGADGDAEKICGLGGVQQFFHKKCSFTFGALSIIINL